ncbi:MAG: DinB family protein [Blastocatellales bacterium]|nr:DinB family protein [Blastocatellales bacterium]
MNRLKYTMAAARYAVGTLAVSAALSMVCIAQHAASARYLNPSQAAESAAPDHIAMIVADWTRAKDYTKEYLDAMPEDGVNFKPTPDIRSFAEQFLHLAGGNFGFAATATGAANPHQGKNLEKMTEYHNKAGLTKIVMESYDFVIASVKAMDAKKLNEQIKVFGRYDMSRGVALNKAFEHQTHHRGQTTIYLRLKGVKPPNEKLF